MFLRELSFLMQLSDEINIEVASVLKQISLEKFSESGIQPELSRLILNNH